jgi:probable HAF family extracellular repeat protein
MDAANGYLGASAVLWTHGRIRNLGTLPGGTESDAFSLNGRRQVVGIANNAVPDPFSLIGWTTQTRGFLWQDGVMHDLGTLGGPDSFAQVINDRGQVAGFADTSVPTTGAPVVDPFLWQDGRMIDLGSLGGTFGQVDSLNDRGQVVGNMNLQGDAITHPFLWNRGRLTDLGTLGGNNGVANWITDTGDVVGVAEEPGSKVHHAFLWRHGVMIDLGTVSGDPCSAAESMNLVGEVVGASGTCQGEVHAFLWERGVTIDLNTVVAPSDLHLFAAGYINDRGEIAAHASLNGANGAQHMVVLIPTDEADREGITSNAPAVGTTGPAAAPRASAALCASVPPWRALLARRYQLFCFGG